ncbi:MAG TPA: DNA repair protein RecN [Cyclobacteriaceae bacterium]|nr:DNA repair protein RecN [Cyclobacteriaceae bacterium]
MLTHLTIKNYALIKQLEFVPSAKLNVITGETGAGKSIMLGAIGLLLGNRADSKTLWDENEKCVTEGIFDISSYSLKELFESENLDFENHTVIRREISPAGKSRAFINDTPVTLEVMRKIGSRLMDIHSQHETLELGTKSFQLNLIDSFASNIRLRETYSQHWKIFIEAQQAYTELKDESVALKKESDFISFQLDELVKADLKEGELEKLESDLKILEHAEEIKTQFNAIIQQLERSDYSVSSVLSAVRNQLQSIASYSPNYNHLLQRLESARIELDDILQEVEHAEEKIEFDPLRTEEIKDRVSTLYQLQHKHRLQDIGQLIELRESLQLKMDKTNNLDELLAQAKASLTKAENNLTIAAADLSKSRQKTFIPLTKQLTQLLKELGIPDASLAIEHLNVAPGPKGSDSIEILFSANKGIPPRPLAQVASGGEFSRVMFSIKYIMAEKADLPTLILDEIDSGVSGEIAIRLGNRMKEIAQRHQIIAISHLPQIAAKADAHFYVFKDNSSARTITSMRKLADNDRIVEIAQMIGGAKPSALALENARELMKS